MFDISFQLVDANTVKVLAEDNPDLLPYYNLNVAKDMKWSRTMIDRSVREAVSGGDSIQRIVSEAFTPVDRAEKSAATRTVRTAMTSAQNVGRMYGYQEAIAMGIEGKIEWVATLDNRTRHSHALLDGEKVKPGDKFPNGCEYPGDPNGPGEEVWNCRCTTVFSLDGIEDDTQAVRVNGTGMEYDEWKAYHASFTKQETGIVSSFATLVANGAPRTVDYLNLVGKSNSAYNGLHVDKELIDKEAERLGIKASELDRVMQDGMKAVIDGGEFGMRIYSADLVKALDEGTFKNVFQTRRSAAGTSTFSRYSKIRKEEEARQFLVPEKTKPADRPIYGMLMPRIEEGKDAAMFYRGGVGSNFTDGVTVILNKEKLINNTTYTLGDSLNNKHQVVGAQLNKPEITGYGAWEYKGEVNSPIDGLVAAARGEMNASNAIMKVAEDYDYIELQVHGAEQHSTDIIDKVVIFKDRLRNYARYNAKYDNRLVAEADELAEILSEAGIPYEIL